MAANTRRGVMGFIALLLRPLLKAITPMIADLVEENLIKLYHKAEATENPIDDLFVEFLLNILDIDVPE